MPGSDENFMNRNLAKSTLFSPTQYGTTVQSQIIKVDITMFRLKRGTISSQLGNSEGIYHKLNGRLGPERVHQQRRHVTDQQTISLVSQYVCFRQIGELHFPKH